MKAILEKINLSQKKSISAFCYSKRDFETPWHFHPQYELTYIKESYGTKFIGDYVGSYSPGELVLVGMNLPHCWKNNVEKDKNATSYVLHWNSGIIADVPELLSVREMLSRSARGLMFSDTEIRQLVPDIKRLKNLESDLLYAELVFLLIKLSKMKAKYLSESKFESEYSDVHRNRISKIHDFVEKNYNRKIYLLEVAELAHMSEQSFSRFFTKMMGRPFFTFLNEYRVNIASRLLIDTDKSVAEIGFECGYESLPFFHKQFNKFKNITPSKYRKQFLVR